MRSRFDLSVVAPRLALAHRQRRAELEAEREERRRARAEVLRAERLVAHRELHLARVTATVHGRRDATQILTRRERKLADAQSWLRRAERRAELIGA